MSSSSNRSAGFIQGVVLLLPITLAVMGIVVLVPVMPALMQQFADVPNHQYLIQGGVLTMPALSAMLFSPLAGWLGDRFGRRSLLIVGMTLYAVVGMAPALLDNLWLIILTRIGVGFCEAIILTITTTMLGDYFSGETRDKWLASQTAVASLSALPLVFIGGLLGESLGWRGPFYIYLSSLVLTLGVLWFTWEPERTQPQTTAVNAAPVVLPWRRLGSICAITLLSSTLFYTMQTQGSIALNALGVVNPDQLGRFAALAQLGVPAGAIVFRFVTSWPVTRLLLVEFILIGIGFVIMGSAHTPTQFVSGALLNQIGCGMILPTLLTWATRGLAFEVRARGTGIWQGTFALGQFVSGVAVTLISAIVGGVLAAHQWLGIVSFLCAGGVLVAMLINKQASRK